MGRKIPSKKHRGVKDPLKQQAQRLQSIKHKINAPPTDPDEQPVPRSLQRLFAFQQNPALGPPARKKLKRAHKAGGGGGASAAHGRDDNPVAALRRLPGEAARAFSLRINSAVRALHQPAQQDYPSDLEEMDNRGDYIASQRERRQRKHRKALAAAERAAGAGPGGAGPGGAGSGGAGPGRAGQAAGAPAERLRKPQRRALKKKEQQKAKEAEAETARSLAARELQYERVAFGDVAHAPPTLPRLRRAPQCDPGAPRPGRRSLLLTQLLAGSPAAPARPARLASAAGAADSERRERARLAAVAAYRQLKAQRATHRQR